MKQVIFKVAAIFIVTFCLASLIPFLPNDFHKLLTVFILLHMMIATLITIHLKRVNSLRIFGIYLTATMLIYCYLNYTDHGLLSTVLHYGFIDFKSIILTLLSTILAGLGIYAIVRDGEFFPISSNRMIIISLVLLFAYLITELPVYHHYPYDHGHSFWRGGHLH